MKQKWNYSNPIFDADKYNDTLLRYSPWSGHRRFGYDLINYYEPEIIVELGSFYGCSAFTFMQAIKDNHLKSQMFPVDLWEAKDTFTLNDYEQDVYSFFNEVKEKEFSSISVQMLKMTFDEASQQFKEKSIDILHIDGSHNYEDVKHDFELWLPKVKENGIILFHDISDQLLYNKTLGSCKYWKEIKKQYNNTEELQYSWGLGILFLDKDRFLDFKEKVDVKYYLKLNTYEETECKDRVRRDYFKLIDATQWIESLKKDKTLLEKDNSKLVDDIQKCKADFEKGIRDKELYINELLDTIDKYKSNNELIKVDYEKTIKEKEKYIGELQEINEKCRRENLEIIKKYEKENTAIKAAYETTIKKKDIYVGELQDAVDGYKNENINIKKSYEETIDGKEKYINELLETVRKYADEINQVKEAYEQTIDGKDNYIKELEEKIRKI